MQLRTVLKNMRQFWGSALALAVALAVAAGIGHYSMTNPKYASQADVMFTSRAFDRFNDPGAASTYATSLIASYSNYLKSPAVMQPLGNSLSPKVSGSALSQSVELTPGPLLLQISYEDANRKTAEKVVTSLRDTLRDQVRHSAPTVGGTPALEITNDTVTSHQVVGTDKSAGRSGVVGALVGLLLGLVYLFLRALVDTRVRSISDIAEHTDASVLGTLPSRGDLGPAAQILGHNLTFIPPVDGVRTVLMAPSRADEGAAAAVDAAARSLAAAGHRVVMVDADLRHRCLTELVPRAGKTGLADVLGGHNRLSEVLVTGGPGEPDVVGAGSSVGNGAELLSGTGFDEVLAELASAHDLVLLCGAPVSEGVDTLTIAPRVSGYVPVVGLGKVSNRHLGDHVELAEMSGATVAGLVVTGARKA